MIKNCLVCLLIAITWTEIEKNVDGGETPNIVFILSDDQGYGDLGCYGSDQIKTPRIDGLAKGGMRFTNFYVHNRCSPTRAALLTGCLADRVGIKSVVYRRDKIGLNDAELTLPELLKTKGYATGLIGKWHLGDWPEFHPNRHGFDYFFGFLEQADRKFGLFENQKVQMSNVSKTDGKFSPKLLQQAKEFMRQNRTVPFFLLYASPLPHTKWKPLDEFKGTSKQGTYGDVVHELDWQVGELLDELEVLKLSDKTIIVFVSDNGPQLNVDGHGSAGSLRDGKWSNFEGGIRTPCIVRWPQQLPTGLTCEKIAAITDFLPTFCEITGVNPPNDRVIDGRSIVSYLKGDFDGPGIYEQWIVPGKTIRIGKWKLFVKSGKAGGNSNGKGAQNRKSVKAGTLFNLEQDPGEREDVSEDHHEVVKELKVAMNRFMNQFEAEIRPAGKLK